MKRFIVILALALLITPALAGPEQGEQWLANALSCPSATSGAGGMGAAIFNDSSSYLYWIGGQDGSDMSQRIYRATDGQTWVILNSSFDPGTTSRAYAGYTWFNGRMWLMGGMGSSTTAVQSTNHTLNSTDGNVWWDTNASSAWEARSHATALVYSSKLWLTGGWNQTSGRLYNDTWFMTTANESRGIWTLATSSSGWQPRMGHTMANLGGKMCVMGGNFTGSTGDVWCSSDGVTWTLTTTQTYLNTYGATVVKNLNGTVFVIGGFHPDTKTTSGVYSTINGASWNTVNASPGFTSRNYSTAIMYNRSGSAVPGGVEENLEYILLMCGGYSTGPSRTDQYYTASPPNAGLSPATATGEVPVQVSWTDKSTGYRDSYVWDFMDGDTESGTYDTDDNPDTGHTFAAAGTYNVSLTILSPFGYDVAYSNVTVSSGIPSYATAQNVRFVVKSAWGSPIEHVAISVVGVNTTAGNWDWLKMLLGMPLDTAPIHNTSLSCYTDAFGGCSFMMFPAVRYDLSITNATLGISETYSVYPKDEYYEIWVTTSESWFTHGYEAIEEINITVTKIRKNTTYGFINITYKDALAGTTGTKIFVNQTNKTGVDLDEITVTSQAITTSDFNASFLVPADDDSYFVTFQIAHSTFGNIVRTFSVIFEKAQVSIGVPSSWLIYLAVFFILFTGMFFGATTSPTIGAILTCFVGWIMWGIGWMDDMGLAAPTVLVFATFISFLSVIMHRSRKERYI